MNLFLEPDSNLRGTAWALLGQRFVFCTTDPRFEVAVMRHFTPKTGEVCFTVTGSQGLGELTT